MKLTRLTAALIAAATAITPLSFNASAPISNAMEDTGAIANLPDWIPYDFNSAVEFRNNYGATHIDNGLICIVYPDRTGEDTCGYELHAEKGTGNKLKQEMYTNGYSETCFDVFVYQPLKQGDIDLTIVDPHVQVKETYGDLEPSVAASYSFTIDQNLSITETDIFSWLPDCNSEYLEYVNSNTILSVKDNYVVFCLSNETGAAYEWSLYDSGKECFDLVTVSDCRHIPLSSPDGGAPNMVYAYKAVKDGYAKIEYDCGLADDDRKDKLILDADCAVINDAQTVLLSGDMRVTLVDYDTDEQIIFKSEENPSIWTNTSYNNNQTNIRSDTYTSAISVSSGPNFTVETNPAILGNNISSSFDADSFSFGLEEKYLPEGYSFIDDEKRPGYYSGTIIPESSMTVTRYDNGSADVVFKLKKNSNTEEKSTTITFYDKDTGELINIPENDEVIFILKCPPGVSAKYEEIYIASNPCTINSLNIYDPSCNYHYYPVNLTDCYDFLEFEVISQDTNHIELSCKMELVSSGDVNNDNDFSVADVVLFQKWLLGSADAKLANWRAADFCRDNKLDIFDLIKMRQRLIEITPPVYVEPDHSSYAPFRTVSDNLKFYLGPGDSYEDIAIISRNTALSELGYQDNNDKWIFTNYRGLYGWIRTVEDDDKTPTIVYVQYPDKPVIYLYPEQETDVHVELELTEAELSTTYPKYNNGWNVTVYPDGKLINKADGSQHRYLFWDAVNCRTRFDYSKGFCVAGSDTESFLKEKLTYMGLNEEEMNEFIVYWLPLMEHNKYNLITFQGDVYTDSAKLNITPTPDSMLRIFMVYVPLEDAIDIEPQQLSTFERKGFTVVEWGGSKIQ